MISTLSVPNTARILVIGSITDVKPFVSDNSASNIKLSFSWPVNSPAAERLLQNSK